MMQYIWTLINKILDWLEPDPDPEDPYDPWLEI